MDHPLDIAGIRNITISGRIASGATTLAFHLSKRLGWEVIDGGKLFRLLMKEKGIPVTDSSQRDDRFDLEYEESAKQVLKTKKHQILQSHLAGFDAQGIEGIFKILLICEDENGVDKADIRIDRLSNRDKIAIDKAKFEVSERERQNLEKWRRLYANNDPSWVYWDPKYFDLVINTYSHNASEGLEIVLNHIGFFKKG
jgi:cytidylate kinase